MAFFKFNIKYVIFEGFDHEQNRQGRDEWVEIKYENILKGKERQFKLCTTMCDNQATDYDYLSIMHYSSYAFSKNPKTKKTIVPKFEVINQKTGHSYGYTIPGVRCKFSPNDIQDINDKYPAPAEADDEVEEEPEEEQEEQKEEEEEV